MFAYCNNNPVIMEDASGTACKISITSETRIDEEPWRDHSPSGGGRVLRNYLSGSNYYGEVADKFFTVKLLNAVGNGLKTASDFLWDSYTRGYNLQQEVQLKETQMIAKVAPRIIGAGLAYGAEAAALCAMTNWPNLQKSDQSIDAKAYVAGIATTFVAGYILGVCKEVWAMAKETFLSE